MISFERLQQMTDDPQKVSYSEIQEMAFEMFPHKQIPKFIKPTTIISMTKRRFRNIEILLRFDPVKRAFFFSIYQINGV